MLSEQQPNSGKLTLTRRAFLGHIAAFSAAPSTFAIAKCLPQSLLFYDQGTLAAPADSLVDFIGVQAHVNWRHTVWDQQAWRPLLGELGIRYVRGKVASAVARDHLLALNAAYGIKACAIVQEIDEDGIFRLGKTREILSFLRDEIGPDKIFAVEGPNEYTSKYKDGNWAKRLMEYQAFLYRKIKGDPTFGGSHVLAPTIWKRNVEEYRAIAGLGAYVDFGNLHLYGGGRKPSIFHRDGSDKPIDVAIADARIVTPGKQVCITETGFQVADGAPTRRELPAEIAAKYMLRNVAELFLRRDKVRWMSIYSLIDDRSGHRYGLLDFDLTRRPAFLALRNLIRLVEDRGPDFVPDTLACNILTEDPRTRALLLQKRDRRFLLILWHDVESYNRQKHEALINIPQPTILDFADHAVGSLRIFRPSLSDTPIQELRRLASVELAVPDDLLIVEIIL